MITGNNDWKKDRRGFTLVEVMLSMMMLSILVVPVSRMFTTSSMMGRYLRQGHQSLAEMRGVMEFSLAVLSELTGDDLNELVKPGEGHAVDSPDSIDPSETTEAAACEEEETPTVTLRYERLTEDAPLVRLLVFADEAQRNSGKPIQTLRYIGQPPWMQVQERPVLIP